MPPRRLLVLLFALAACASSPTKVADRATDKRLAAEVRAIVAELGPGMRAAVWFGPAQGEPLSAAHRRGMRGAMRWGRKSEFL